MTALSVFDRGPAQPAPQVSAGQIGKLHGLAGVRIGDPIGVPRNGSGRSFAPPNLETIVVAARQRDRGALHAALTQLAEQDPLINLRLTARDDIALSLYGEVQKEVIEATLSTEYGIEVTFRESTTIHTERVAGTGAAHRIIATDGNPFLATVGLKVEPAPG